MKSRRAQCEQIADGLAGQGFSMVDRFLSKEDVKHLLRLEAFSNGFPQLKKAAVGKQEKKVNENIRGDYIQWIDRETADPALKIYFERLNELISYINRSLFLSLKDFELHLTVYPPGSFYRRHLDQFRQDDHRRLSVIFYLNENWNAGDGGQLRLHLPDGPVDFLPLAGRFICFRSDKIEHEVLPAARDRLSLTGWILDRLSGLGHL